MSKTIQELAKTWTHIVKEYGYIPRDAVLDEHVVNGFVPDISQIDRCFVGEARGGGCYFDQYIKKDGSGTYKAGEGAILNPKYCNTCRILSIQFYDEAGVRFDIEEYGRLCKEYADHYNACHNGDKC